MEVNFPTLLDFELKKARVFLPIEDSGMFFRATLKLFCDRIEIDVGKQIIQTYLVMFSRDAQYIEYFIKSDYLDRIPYQTKDLSKDLVRLLLVISNRVPSFISEGLFNKFLYIIDFCPNESLVVISNCLNLFSGLNHQWTMVDLLFSKRNLFHNPISGSRYAKIVSFIMNIDQIRERYFSMSYSCIYSLLESCEPSIINDSYSALAYISSFGQISEIPYSIIGVHVLHNEVRSKLLDFLLVVSIDPSHNIDTNFSKNLFFIAQYEQKAFHVNFYCIYYFF